MFKGMFEKEFDICGEKISVLIATKTETCVEIMSRSFSFFASEQSG